MLSSSGALFFPPADTLTDRSIIKVSSADALELLSLAIVARLLAAKQLVFVLPPSGRLLRTVDLSPFDDGWPKVLEAGGCKESRGWMVGQRPKNWRRG